MGDTTEGDESYQQRLEAKLHPDQVRATLSFAGLYQITHEMIKHSVLDEVRQFYWSGYMAGKPLYDEDAYQRQVMARAPKNKFRASLLWLVDGGAIDTVQADRLEVIMAHRNELTHELLKYIIDPDFEPDVDLFQDALTILKAIRRFWTSIEMDIGTFEDYEGLSPDEITPLSLAVLQLCIDAFVAEISPADQDSAEADSST